LGSAVERVFSTVRLRTVALIFVSLTGLFWALPLLGLILGLIGVINAPLEAHTLWSADTPPQLFQAIVAGIAVWKMTAVEGDYEK
jgi:hypothetical protein